MNDLDLYEAPEVASKMLVAAMGLIGSVTSQQRGHLWLSLDDPARQDWDIIPRPEHTGLSMHDLSASQRILVWDLIAAALPERTFTQATLVPELEHVLRDYEADFLGRALSSWRDPLNYFVTIFGRPGFEDTWAFRFYGHHLGINLTVIKERWIVAGPSAMGQQPVNYDGVNKPLHDEESAAFAIIESLDDDKLARAVIHPVSPADFVTRYVPRIGAVEYPDVIDLGMPQYRLSDKDRIATRLALTSHPVWRAANSTPFSKGTCSRSSTVSSSVTRSRSRSDCSRRYGTAGSNACTSRGPATYAGAPLTTSGSRPSGS